MFYFLIIQRSYFEHDLQMIFELIIITLFHCCQGYEDWLRHRADKEVNHREVELVKDGEIVNVRSMDIKVGFM